MAFRITMEQRVAPVKFKQNLAGLADRMEAAFTAAMNMAASMIKQQADADISAAGNFGSRWTDGLHVNISGTLGNMRISMSHDIDYAGIFETGGTIHGSPLLWLPLSFANPGPISEFGGQLFSVKRKSGRPLLFSMADKLPKYFGIESVTIPKKFHLNQVQKSVMANFRSIFDTAFRQV